MKYSLHNRISSQAYLKKADEIIMEYRDRKVLLDYAEKFPNAIFIIEIFSDTEWEVEEIKKYYEMTDKRLVLCVASLTDKKIKEIKELNIPFYWGYGITSFWELQSLINFGVSQVKIEAPLFFNCDKLQNYDIPKRVSVNMAHEGYIPGTDGIIGAWIRPEDIQEYEDTFTSVEFLGCNQQQEEALFRIYAEQKFWNSRLDMIISNVTTEAYNRMIPENFVNTRKNCNQRCTSGGACRVCYRILGLANPTRIKKYLKQLEEKAGEKEQS